MRRQVRLAAVAAGVLLTLSAPALAAVPLTGETASFESDITPGNSIAFQCVPTGESTFAFSGTGVAQGPYPGTVTITGSGSFGPQTIPTTQPPNAAPYFGLSAGPELTFHEDFRIDSPATGSTVTGVKDGVIPAPAGSPVVDQLLGVCNDVNTPVAIGSTRHAATYTNYDATIRAPDGVFRDRGFAYVQIDDFSTIGVQGNGFFQEWHSTSFGQAGPTTTDDCKRGGWRNYPQLDFKNQGDCVSYVATGGRNPPAGA